MADAKSILRSLLADLFPKASKDDVEIKPITSGGANYTSELYLATIKGSEEINLFAKVACIGKIMREKMDADKLFGTERIAYSKLAKAYDKIQEFYEVPKEHRFVFPKFYGCNSNYGEETVVLENLVAKGYSSFDRFKSMDWEHACSSMSSLAKFHALSYAYEKHNKEEFDFIIGEVRFEPRKDDENTKGVWEKMIGNSIALLSPEDRGKVVNIIKDFKDLYRKFNSPFSRPVLIHGDYRPSNLLFKKQGTRIEAMPVDYQTIRAGCPLADVIYFIFMGTDKEFRRKHYQALIGHYYNELVLALERFKMDPVEVYPRNLFEEELKDMLPYAVLLGVAILPIVTVEAHQAPRVDGNSDITQFALEPNELYASRFRGVIEDCVQMGVI